MTTFWQDDDPTEEGRLAAENNADRAAGFTLLPSTPEFGIPRGRLSVWWAARALHDPDLSDEDREMAEAAYSRAMDEQLNIVGRGRDADSGLRECFPSGDRVRAEREEWVRLAAERNAAAPATLFDGFDL